MTTNTPKPFGEMQIQYLFGLDAIQGVGRRSNTWQVLEAFVRQNEAVASRVAFGTSGVAFMTTIPDDPTSGMFYIYDSRTQVFFMLDFEGKNNFTASLFDMVMTAYGLDELISFPVEKRQSHRQHRHHHNGRRKLVHHLRQPASLAAAA